VKYGTLQSGETRARTRLVELAGRHGFGQRALLEAPLERPQVFQEELSAVDQVGVVAAVAAARERSDRRHNEGGQ
jgi:hypothetical protein